MKTSLILFLVFPVFFTCDAAGIPCNDGDFVCEDDLKCIPSDLFCDGKADCSDGSDEIIFNENSIETQNGIPCRRDELICLLQNSQLAKKNYLCVKNNSCEFECNDGSKCIDSANFCNNDIDCRDGSDETVYTGQVIHGERECVAIDGMVVERQCLLPSSYICDGHVQCKHGVDECLCHDGGDSIYLDEKCFRCFSHPHIVIPIYKLCDRVFDCPDLSDECMCTRKRRLPTVCSRIEWGFTNGISQKFGCLGRKYNKPAVFGIEVVCDSKIDCKGRADERNCNNQCLSARRNRGKTISKFGECGFTCPNENNQATKCDRRITCTYDGYDEECKDCRNKPKFCQLSGNGSDSSSFYCPSGEQIGGLQICDGMPDCEHGEEELDCHGRYYCKSGIPINIPITKECDRRRDCEDGSDENKCKYFHCNDSGHMEFIDWKRVCDGTVDCEGGGDECRSECITSVFSDTESLIANQALLAFVWIMSLAAFISNIFVAILSGSNMVQKGTKNNRGERINRGLIFNLSLSDLLVGIYTISICIKNSTQKGRYCYEDREWRSGSTCAALGTIMLIGSEQSVFTLTIITGHRLYTVLRPFSPGRAKLISALVGLSWFLSCFIAMIPLSSLTRDFFVESIWYRDNNLFSIVRYENVTSFTHWLILTQKHINESSEFGPIGTWSRLENMILKLNPNYTVHGRFGYYSKHGVCLASFFPNLNSKESWMYTLFIVLVNFSSFVFILTGYIVIYKKSNTKTLAVDALRRQDDRATAMQKKITRILVTDFLCWMPICIMALLHFAGILVPDDAYIPVGMILIPINSALNPFLYSNAPDYIWKKLNPLRVWINKHCNCVKIFEQVSADWQGVNRATTEETISI